MKKPLFVTLLITLQLLFSAAYAQPLSRLVAKANWVHNGTTFVPHDSTVYTYSNPHGGDLVFPLEYDTATTFVYTTAWRNYQRIVKSYNSDDLLFTYVTTFWDSTHSQWVDTNKYKWGVNHDPARKPIELMGMDSTAGAWIYRIKDDYVYDTLLNINIHIHSIFSGGGWMPIYKRLFTFGTGLNTNQQCDWDYNQGTFFNTNDFDLTYHNVNQIQTCKYQAWNGSGYTDSCKFLYAYDTLGNWLSKTYLLRNVSTGVWDQKLMSTYSAFTSGHMPQVETDSWFNPSGSSAWVDTFNYKYAYNGVNQMTWRQGMPLGSSTSGAGNPLSRYYYSPYTISGVQPRATSCDLVVFPNPADATVNVQFSWRQPEACTITLCDVTGKEVYKLDVVATEHYNAVIPTHYLKSGTYFLKITGNSANVTRMVSVLH